MSDREDQCRVSLSVYQCTEGHWIITEGVKATWPPSKDQLWGLQSGATLEMSQKAQFYFYFQPCLCGNRQPTRHPCEKLLRACEWPERLSVFGSRTLAVVTHRKGFPTPPHPT